ncbi:hypothetical protein GJAV_G00203120 [Gymnothorax javanicus]|nr:hypothetical protein GJAV_G00203120 [Gymnothorax javanicus]
MYPKVKVQTRVDHSGGVAYQRTTLSSLVGLTVSVVRSNASVPTWAGSVFISVPLGEDELKKASSERLTTVHLDVANTESVSKAATVVKTLVAEKGLWAVVNNAGVSVPSANCDWLTIEDYKSMLDVNLTGVIAVTLSVLPLIKKARGRVVNVASVFGRISAIGGPYCVSKFGVEAFNDSLRRNMKPFGVKVLCIEPGFFKTTVTDMNATRKSLAHLWAKLPQEVKEDYGHDFLDRAEVTLKKMEGFPDPDLMKVVHCMEHAISAVHPRSRYSPGLSSATVREQHYCAQLHAMPKWMNFKLSKESGHLLGGGESTAVLQDVSAGCCSELSIQSGQTVEILEQPNHRPNWCPVRATDRSPPQEGLEPSSALCVSKSRSSAEMDCFFRAGKENYTASVPEVKREPVSPPQSQASMSSIQPSSPGPKRSANTLRKWLTSPVRRLSHGKADNNLKKIPSKHKKREGSRNADLGVPRLSGGEILPQDVTTDERSRKEGTLSKLSGSMQSRGEEPEPPLPPAMEIDRDPSSQDNKMQEQRSNGSFTPLNFTNPRDPAFEQKAKALRGRKFVLNELIQSEKDYVKDLGVVVEGFMKRIKVKGVPEEMKGKDKIVFGNIHQIYDWHRDFFLGELEKCLEDHDHLAELFIKHERRLHMYVVYCQNKPRSEYIVAEYDAYFEEVQQEIDSRLTISDYLIKPIQRITKYQLLLKDFLKYTSKAGMDCQDIENAVDLMFMVPKRCNDMMNLGRLQGFEGKLTSQGKLLQQETFFVAEQDSGVLSRSKERRVFLFEQIVIFSELLRKGSSTPGYQFKKSIKVSYLSMDPNVDNDPCKFVLYCRGSSERFTLQAANQDIKEVWIHHITEVLEAQRNFLSALQSPIEYQKKEISLSRNPSGCRRPSQSSSRPHSSSSTGSERPPLSGRTSTPVELSTSNDSSCHDSHKDSEQRDSFRHKTAGCNGMSRIMLVTKDYSPLKENEICVTLGEKVQILASNQQNMFLVFRQAGRHSPAAEGWVPAHVLGTLTEPLTDCAEGCAQ